MTVDGLVTILSASDPQETARRFIAEIAAAQMTVFARIDHAAAATQAGLELPPTEVIIFGNARTGTPLMVAAPTLGIDLPLKVLVWRDSTAQTWLSYNDPSWLMRRHGLSRDENGVAARMSNMLATIARKVTGSDQ